jgi:hypothetical protein
MTTQATIDPQRLRLLLAVAEVLELPKTSCGMRACRRSGRCCAGRNQTPLCCGLSGLPQEDAVKAIAFLACCCELLRDFDSASATVETAEPEAPAWLAEVHPPLLPFVIDVGYRLVGLARQRRFRRWLKAVGAWPQPASRSAAGEPAVFEPPAMSTAANAAAISSGPTPGLVASEDRSWR